MLLIASAIKMIKRINISLEQQNKFSSMNNLWNQREP